MRVLLMLTLCAATAGAQSNVSAVPAKDYYVYVLSESADRISRLKFNGATLSVDTLIDTGVRLHAVDGPHGIAVAPDGRHFFVTLAHGMPYGSLWKYSATGDSVLGRVDLGMYPATVTLTPDGMFAFVVNFNLQGEMIPSSVSIVSTEDMNEVARTRTCAMPHGSRISPDGTKHYSACMMDDILVEIDTRNFGVSRHFILGKGSEHGMPGAPKTGPAKADHDMSHGMNPPKPGDVSCSPTWAQPSANGARLFVACNKSSDIVEIDVAKWTMTRRIPTGDGIYNLAITSDAKLLLGTNKRGKSVSVIDIASGKELARVPTKRGVVHGIVVTPDDRYAFVTAEGLASDPGTVEVIDLQTMKVVAAIDVGAQAGGIDFFKVVPRR